MAVTAQGGPCTAEDAVRLIGPGSHVVVSSANGEPATLLEAIERAVAGGALHDITIHQMHPLAPRGYMAADARRARYIAYFLSSASRPRLGRGVEFMPCNYSEAPALMRRRARTPIVLASVGRRDGAPSWGTNGDYSAALVRDGAPAICEVNERQPSLPGHALPAEQLLAQVDVARELHVVEPPAATDVDRRIGARVAERIPDGATLQVGIGAIPDTVLDQLHDRRDLRVHTELLTDGIMRLAQAGALAASAEDPIRATFTLGSPELYAWMDGNPLVRIAPVDEINAPAIVASQPRMTSICATTEVDLYGQCASETVAGRYYSGTGGQLDFIGGARRAPGGRSFIVLRSTGRDGSSRITPSLAPYSVVSVGVHVVDKVVTEWGVAELAGRTLAERARSMIAIAHPDHRDELTRHARAFGLVGASWSA